MKRLYLAAVAALALSASVHAADAPNVIVDNAVVEFMPAEQALRVDGVVGQRFETDIREALERHPGVRRLVVTGPGGMRAQALRVAEMVNARGITVRIAGRCASACALLWAAADAREMTFDSGVGLHRSALDPSLGLPDRMRRSIMARNDRQTDEVLRRARFPERVIAAGAATPASTMSWFSPYELKTGGVPFVLLDPSGHVAALDPSTGRLSASASLQATTTRN